MRILRNYILKEFLYSFLLSLVVFTFAFLIGNIIQIANLVINKGVSIISVFKLLFFMIRATES
jgi:lipopolysaccharide export LptBFGC system permease protein LptF